MFSSKYHLPHNAVRIDEFNHMLNSIDLNKEFYTYKELRLLFLQKQIASNKLSDFHNKYDQNLREHRSHIIRGIYNDAIICPSEENLNRLLEVQYTPRKTFKQVWNETVRDYTEFFAFLGLLPTYYKGRAGGDNRHYVSDRLKCYIQGELSLEDLLLDFKFRNTSKNEDNYEMYSITVRPFVVALKALKYFFDNGFNRVNRNIISAIVVYAKNDSDSSIYELCKCFDNPESSINTYCDMFASGDSVQRELGRASTFLSPYLRAMGYVEDLQGVSYYTRGTRTIDLNSFPSQAVYCGTRIGSSGIALTPEIGQVIYQLLGLAKKRIESVPYSRVFRENMDINDQRFIVEELSSMGCISCDTNSQTIFIHPVNKQFAINPYTDFYTCSDSNFVNNIDFTRTNLEGIRVENTYQEFDNDISLIEPIAKGSNGAKYEEAIYNLLQKHFPVFNAKWYGQSSAGQRLSDIYITTNILDDENQPQKIAIIIECKAGNAIRAIDERKEADDIKRTLSKNNGDKVSGVWYWIVDSDSLPSVNSHGGYRSNDNSYSFIEKLNYLQYTILANKRVPSLVTAFSFDAIKGYLTYLYAQLNENGPIEEINRINAPHFWVWSKKFMHLQYVQVYKEWR